MAENSDIKFTSCWPSDDLYGIARCTEDVWMIGKASTPTQTYYNSTF